MKRSLIAVAVVFSATTYAGLQSLSEGPAIDRSLPTYPELGFDGWRNNAGESENGNYVQIQVGENKYRLDAGQPTSDLVVQDYFSS